MLEQSIQALSDLAKTHEHHHVKNNDYPYVTMWITFLLMAVSALGFTIIGSTQPMKLRAHAFVGTAITTIAAASYYALATHTGHVDVLTGNGTSAIYRDVFYVRYIDWTFTTPLLLLSVLLIAGAPFGHVAWILFLDVLMIVLGLVGALVVGKDKWGWFIIACVFQALITYGLLVPVLQAAKARDQAVVKPYLTYAAFLGLVWIGYPIVWALSEGTNLINERSEAGAYALLDIIAKVVFGWIVILGVGPLHKIQGEEEKQAGSSYVSPLTTPIGDIWGTNTASSGQASDNNEPLLSEA